VAAPQGLYACRGDEQWLALAVATDAQWHSLRQLLGDPAWACDAAFDHGSGRRRAHDVIDEHLRAWAAEQDAGAVVERLCAAGVPSARVVDPIELLDNPQLRARGTLEAVDSPLLGRHETLSLPFRYASRHEPWTRHPAPTLGQHNREVLVDVLGLDDAAVEQLVEDAVIGNEPVGARSMP
jgi:crotonobetainyl-CoA:carnitine CoA-transferase CaiB-like acyl-CoA transferase